MKIFKVVRSSQDSGPVRWFELVVTTESANSYAFELCGWALGRDKPVHAVEVRMHGKLIGGCH